MSAARIIAPIGARVSPVRASRGGVTASAAVPTTQTGISGARDGDLLVGRRMPALATVRNPVTVRRDGQQSNAGYAKGGGDASPEDAGVTAGETAPQSQANAVAEAKGTITAQPPKAETVSRVAPGRTGDGAAEAGAAHSVASNAGSQADVAAGGVTVGGDESGTAAYHSPSGGLGLPCAAGALKPPSVRRAPPLNRAGRRLASDDPEALERAKALAADGMSLREISVLTGWSAPVLCRFLRSGSTSHDPQGQRQHKLANVYTLHQDGSVELCVGGRISTFFDAQDFDLVRRYHWNAAKGGRRKKKVYFQTKTGGRQIYLHKLILGAVEECVGDHSDGDTLNNRRSNLRQTDAAGNARNRRGAPSASGFRGVQVVRGRERLRFVAGICVKGASRYLGSFATAEEAARAYDQASRALHGEFGILNFPEAHQ